MEIISFENIDPVIRVLWDPRTNRMEETNNRAIILLNQLLDSPTVDTEAFKRVANICDHEEIENRC